VLNQSTSPSSPADASKTAPIGTGYLIGVHGILARSPLTLPAIP
jgi:hypothetical protein